jgi:hypothetical protein
MAAGGWFDWSTGDLVTEARFQDIQDSIVFIFAGESAANSALTNKVTGTIFYDTSASLLKAWNGSSWIGAEAGDIEGITTAATSGLNGGATSGTPSLVVDPTRLTDGTSITVDTGNDFLILYDASGSATKKVNPSQIASTITLNSSRLFFAANG